MKGQSLSELKITLHWQPVTNSMTSASGSNPWNVIVNENSSSPWIWNETETSFLCHGNETLNRTSFSSNFDLWNEICYEKMTSDVPCLWSQTESMGGVADPVICFCFEISSSDPWIWNVTWNGSGTVKCMISFFVLGMLIENLIKSISAISSCLLTLSDFENVTLCGYEISQIGIVKRNVVS